MRLTLYSKPGCHLCEDLRGLLEELQAEFGYVIDEIDITSDEILFARYRYDIPVLLKEGKEIARGRVSDRELVHVLSGAISP